MMSRIVLLVVAASAAGCSRNPSVLLETAGPHAASIKWLFWVFFGIAVVVYALVLLALGVALLRSRRNRDTHTAPSLPAEGTERGLMLGVMGAVACTVLVLMGMLVASFAVDRQLITLDSKYDLEIEVTAHQWWWELRYLDTTPGRIFTTANEIHVPINRSVRLKLRSSDVIHSVWFPNLAGKRDVIPGREQSLTLQADKPGVWLGRCGEFCGNQHAFMGLTLIAESPEAFETWQDAQRAPAQPPKDDEAMRGQQVFANGPCAQCHVIRGTDATGHSNIAPDLTHLKSRQTIGAGAAPNTKGHLGGWIIDPHGLKPGVHMPLIPQNAPDFQALLAYLEGLT